MSKEIAVEQITSHDWRNTLNESPWLIHQSALHRSFFAFPCSLCQCWWISPPITNAKDNWLSRTSWLVNERNWGESSKLRLRVTVSQRQHFRSLLYTYWKASLTRFCEHPKRQIIWFLIAWHSYESIEVSECHDRSTFISQSRML